jgi:predicted GNAT family N-acyltransferase
MGARHGTGVHRGSARLALRLLAILCGMSLQVRESLSGDHAEQLLAMFGMEWWTDRRSADEVGVMLRNSDLVIALVEEATDRLVGFARVLTDEIYLAVILDVMVARDFRGHGTGQMLIEAVLNHPTVANVNSIELVCQPDLMHYYERWGFTGAIGSSRLMRRTSDATLAWPQ